MTKPRRRRASKPVKHVKPVATETETEGRRRYMIQIEHADGKPSMQQIRELLSGTGVEIESSYGPIPVNPSLGRYVVRGWAEDDARRRAERIPGVQFFGDAKIAPAGPPR